jgi:hypothetical protein
MELGLRVRLSLAESLRKTYRWQANSAAETTLGISEKK